MYINVFATQQFYFNRYIFRIAGEFLSDKSIIFCFKYKTFIFGAFFAEMY